MSDVPRSDCNFYSEKRCGILTEMLCENGKCSFHKTVEEYRNDLIKYPACNYAAIYARKHRKDKKRGENV